MGVEGKLYGPWKDKQVIKLGRRPDAQGQPVTFPKEAPVWNPDSKKVMVWIDLDGQSTRAKLVPCEMPIEEVFKKCRLNYKQLVIKSVAQPPWQNWQTTNAEFHWHFTGISEFPKTKEEVDKMLARHNQRRDEELTDREAIRAKDKVKREFYDTYLEDIEQMIRDKEKLPRPKGAIVVMVKANIDDPYVIRQPVAVDENNDILEVMRKALFNPKVFKAGDQAPPWRDGEPVYLYGNRKSKHWKTEQMRTSTRKERTEERIRQAELKILYEMKEKRAWDEGELKARPSEEERREERQSEIDAQVEKKRRESET
jgi:hypothetical protein